MLRFSRNQLLIIKKQLLLIIRDRIDQDLLQSLLLERDQDTKREDHLHLQIRLLALNHLFQRGKIERNTQEEVEVPQEIRAEDRTEEVGAGLKKEEEEVMTKLTINTEEVSIHLHVQDLLQEKNTKRLPQKVKKVFNKAKKILHKED